MRRKKPKNKSEYNWLQPIISCDNCQRTCKPIDATRIHERKNKKFTGREFNLCPECRYDYMNDQIENLDIKLDEKYKLDKWNKGVRIMSS